MQNPRESWFQSHLETNSLKKADLRKWDFNIAEFFVAYKSISLSGFINYYLNMQIP